MKCKITCVGLLLMAYLLMINVQAASSPNQDPEVYVRVTFNIAWARFCYLAPLFKHRLSDILIEERDGFVFLVPTSRIHIINMKGECKYMSGNVKIAVVDFFIGSYNHSNKVDKKYTEQAYKILYHYWEAHRMVLLGPTFERMVDNVEILGKDAPEIPKKLNEEQRLLIGIAVGLVIVIAVVLLYFYKYHWNTNKATKLEDTRRHRVYREESLTSKGTDNVIMDDDVGGSSGLVEIVNGKPIRKGASARSDQEDTSIVTRI